MNIKLHPFTQTCCFQSRRLVCVIPLPFSFHIQFFFARFYSRTTNNTLLKRCFSSSTTQLASQFLRQTKPASSLLKIKKKKKFFFAKMSAFSEEQRLVWEWWVQESKNVNIFSHLDEKDKKMFDSNAPKYDDDKEGVIRSRTSYLQTFYAIRNSDVAPKYNFDQVLPVLLLKTQEMHRGTMEEPKKESEIASYVFSKCMSTKEQDGFRKNVFLNDKSRAEDAVKKFARLSAEWMVKLGGLDEKEKDKKEEEIYCAKMAYLNENYK